MNMTYHCEVHRANRVQNIIKEIGVGQVVKEKYIRYNIGEPGKYICLTDTGITLIKSEDKATIITMYVTTQRELVSVFGGAKKVPAYLRKKVDHNQSKFTEKGKTIWK